MHNLQATALGGRFYGIPINLTVANAVDHGLNQLALHVGLSPLDWRIVPDEVGMVEVGVVEGVPFPASPEPGAVCEAWARALNLSEHLPRCDARAWFRVDAGWHVALSTRRAA